MPCGSLASQMAELYIIGQLQSGKDLNCESGLFCKWSIQAGSGWKRVAGPKEGQTQVDTPKYSDTAKWAHPIDIQFVSKGLQGWPKLIVEVCRQDEFGRTDLSGYGVCHIPASPGTHIIEVPTWRPAGSVRDEVVRHFVGGSSELAESDLITNPTERYRLRTVPSGIVTVELSLILRNFDKFGVET